MAADDSESSTISAMMRNISRVSSEIAKNPSPLATIDPIPIDTRSAPTTPYVPRPSSPNYGRFFTPPPRGRQQRVQRQKPTPVSSLSTQQLPPKNKLPCSETSIPNKTENDASTSIPADSVNNPLKTPVHQPAMDISAERLGSRQACKSQSQLKSDAEAKQKQINKVFMNLKIAEKVGVCFMVDCTGSMGSWINEIKKKIKSWSEQLHANHTHLELHLAFVRYTDYDLSPSSRTTSLDFTTDIHEFYRFVDGIRAEGGEDEAEDVFGGLDAILKLNWQKVGTKVLIHIADAPCHGAQYHDSVIDDDYPKGDPGGLKLDDLMKQLADKQIAYHFGYIKKSRTLAMIKAFNSSLLVQSGRHFSIQQFDSRQTSDLTENVFRTITVSIGTTCDVLTAETSRRLCNFMIDEKMPSWDDIPAQQVLVTPPPQPGAIAMLEHPKTPMSVKIAPEPFGEGTQRIAYHGLDVAQNSHIVIKRSKWTDERSNCLKRCLETANVHAIAAKFSAQFNEEKPFIVSSSEVRFIPVGVMQIKENGKEQNFTYEMYLGCSEFTKFNSNFAYVPESKDHTLNATCQAFSHYTWVRSGKQLVVCDLQGKKVGPNVILTDPAIHDSVSVLHHGATNLGEKGIERFFQLHKCNDICRAMQLERPKSE